MEKIKVSLGQMNLLLAAVEHGFREHERGKNLQGALASIYDLYEVEKPRVERTHSDIAREWAAP